ncbi:MAG: Rrf2 family transcriptional regulator [Candidatus Omnitrophica bacterium]|nr:Rrf2 family transcriptional regulator [Candidatus Omnitrophota bacterium]
MKLITRDTDYAMRALIYAAKEKNKRVNVRDIVKEVKIPRPFLRKIVQLLNKKGMIKSYKGKGGGFTLARKPNEIYLMDLIEIFQGPFSLNECFFKRHICPNSGTCFLNKKITRIEKHVLRELRPITIASLLGKEKN